MRAVYVYFDIKSSSAKCSPAQEPLKIVTMCKIACRPTQWFESFTITDYVVDCY